MSKLRDEIKSAVLEELYEERNVYGYGDESRAADAILARVREALLSNDVQAPIRQELHDYPRTSPRGTVSTVIEMALDAVTGEGGER